VDKKGASRGARGEFLIINEVMEKEGKMRVLGDVKAAAPSSRRA